MVKNKDSISVTLTQQQRDIITADATKNNRSISAEIGHLITHNKENEATFRIIFAELDSLKKALLERLL